VHRRDSAPLILSLAPPESYAPLARITLSRAGYSIVSVERWAEMSQSVANAPDLAIADLECEGIGIPPSTPWLALAPRGAPHPTRMPIVGLIERPATFHALYRVIQLARVSAPAFRLTARARRGAGTRSWSRSPATAVCSGAKGPRPRTARSRSTSTCRTSAGCRSPAAPSTGARARPRWCGAKSLRPTGTRSSASSKRSCSPPRRSTSTRAAPRSRRQRSPTRTARDRCARRAAPAAATRRSRCG